MQEVYGTVEAAKPLVDIKSKTNYYNLINLDIPFKIYIPPISLISF